MRKNKLKGKGLMVPLPGCRSARLSVFAFLFLFLFAGAGVAITAPKKLAAPAALITFSHDTMLLSDARSQISEHGWPRKNLEGTHIMTDSIW